MPIKLTHRASIRQTGNNRRGVPPRVREALKADLEAYGQLHVADRMRFVATWKGSTRSNRFEVNASGGDIPSFDARVEEKDEVIKLRIVLTGPPYGKLKYRWTSGGTQVRRSLLSEDWGSKTSKRNVNSGGGSGRVITAGKQFNEPGIEARQIDEHLQDVLEPPFVAMIKAKYKFPITITSRAGVTRG